MQQCWARLLSKKKPPHRLRCSAVGWGLPRLCRLAYIWREAWRNLSDVQSSVCRFEPAHSSPSFCRPGSLTEKKKLTKYVMSWAVKRTQACKHTHTHIFQKAVGLLLNAVLTVNTGANIMWDVLICTVSQLCNFYDVFIFTAAGDSVVTSRPHMMPSCDTL